MKKTLSQKIIGWMLYVAAEFLELTDHHLNG
jgi:hypothetical protein